LILKGKPLYPFSASFEDRQNVYSSVRGRKANTLVTQGWPTSKKMLWRHQPRRLTIPNPQISQCVGVTAACFFLVFVFFVIFVAKSAVADLP
jgi:hypothetical protein